jgi:hypothetical protein
VLDGNSAVVYKLEQVVLVGNCVIVCGSGTNCFGGYMSSILWVWK